jgi:hypothetical protein
MLDVFVDPKSVDATVEYIDAVKLRILDAVRSGMTESMQLLAETVVGEMAAAGVQNRTGELESNILRSPRVTETESEIRGRVFARALVKAKGGAAYWQNMGNIFDMGFRDPKVKSGPHQIVGPTGDTFWARGHAAFDVRPHPFFKRSADVAEAPIMDLIRSRVVGAAEGA